MRAKLSSSSLNISNALAVASDYQLDKTTLGATSVFGELQDALDRIWRAPARDRSARTSKIRVTLLQARVVALLDRRPAARSRVRRNQTRRGEHRDSINITLELMRAHEW